MTARAPSLRSADDTPITPFLDETRSRSGFWVLRRGWLVGIIVALPALVAALSVIGRHWFPASDWALILLRVNDVGTSHTPLVGVPSRYGWYHPGPWIFWLLTPSYFLFSTTGTLLGTALINGIAITGTVYTAWRRGGAALGLWCGALVAILVHTFGPAKLVDPWNPWIALLPLLWFTLLAWSAGCGDLVALPWAAGVGSFVVQTHVGYAPVVVALFGLCILVAIGVVWWRRRHGLPGAGQRSRRSAWFWAGMCLLVLAVFWLPPAIQQISGQHGNLGEIWRYFQHPSEKSIGWTAAVGSFGKQLTPPGPWVTGRDTTSLAYAATAAAWPAVLLLVVTGLLGIVAWRRKAGDAAWLAAFAVLAAIAGIVATSHITGQPFPYLMRWWWVIALLQWLAIGWCVARIVGSTRWREASTRWRGVQRGVGAVLAGGIVALTLASIAAALPVPLPQPEASTAIRHVVGPTAAALRPHTPYTMDIGGNLDLSGVAVGLFTELRRRGFEMYGTPDQSKTFDTFRVRGTNQTTATVGVRDATGAGYPLPPGARVIARYDPLSARERAELNRLNQQLRAVVGNRAPQGLIPTAPPVVGDNWIRMGAPPNLVHRLSQLEAKGSPLDVYLAPNQPATAGG